jgi:hypothetical protein
MHETVYITNVRQSVGKLDEWSPHLRQWYSTHSSMYMKVINFKCNNKHLFLVRDLSDFYDMLSFINYIFVLFYTLNWENLSSITLFMLKQTYLQELWKQYKLWARKFFTYNFFFVRHIQFSGVDNADSHIWFNKSRLLKYVFSSNLGHVTLGVANCMEEKCSVKYHHMNTGIMLKIKSSNF